MRDEPPAGCGIRVRLTPRAGRDRVDGTDEAGTLLVRVAAPPVEGAANESLVRLLAHELGVGRTAVRIGSGASGRVKRLRVDVAPDRVRARWPGVATVD